MPYEGEFASKASHFDIVKNPEVEAFLKDCEYLKQPSDEECEAVAAQFVTPPTREDISLPSYVIAVDGSNYEASISEKLPNTRIGYIKVSSILIDLNEFDTLRTGRYVDPFRVAKLQDDNSSLTFLAPSANVRWGGKLAVRDSFRALVDKQLYDIKTRFNAEDPLTSLRTTLFHLASRRPGDMNTGDLGKLKLHKCPDCEKGPITVEDVPEQQYCPHCGHEIYPSDCLRLWEEVNDFQSNQVAISRLMLILEHLVPFHYLRFLLKQAPAVLSEMAVFVDGPLAIFGNAAWLHRSIMIFLAEVNKKLEKLGANPMIIIGLQKTGQVADHASLIERFIPNNSLYPIDDEYRYKYILSGRDPANNGFGYETYYGQDFIFKTPTGRVFIFALPYPFDSKDVAGVDFVNDKTGLGLYPQLSEAIELINHLESDLYKNAVIPIALAHRYTAISFVPGGKVLDTLTKKALAQQ